MKTCADGRHKLAELVFGELDDRTEIDLNEHLLACAECRDEERRLLALQDAARTAGATPPPELRTRIRAALERDLAPHGVPLLRRRVPGYVALAAGVLGALLVAALPARNPARVAGGAGDRPAPRSQPGTMRQGDPLPFMIAASSETRVSGAGLANAPRSVPQTRSVPEDSL
jgi:anti-sigma factor RsiW